MTLPDNISKAQVIGMFMNSDGTPCAGTVTFHPQPCYWRNSEANVMITGTPQVQSLDANGTFEAIVIATDNADLVPSGWLYTCRVTLTDCHRQLSFPLAAPAGEVIDISDALRETA